MLIISKSDQFFARKAFKLESMNAHAQNGSLVTLKSNNSLFRDFLSATIATTDKSSVFGAVGFFVGFYF